MRLGHSYLFMMLCWLLIFVGMDDAALLLVRIVKEDLLVRHGLVFVLESEVGDGSFSIHKNTIRGR